MIGPTGPTGPPGTGGPTTCLPSKASETGVWTASIGGTAGASQQEAGAAVSLQIPLCEKTPGVPTEGPVTVEAEYLTEKVSENPAEYTALGCKGSQNEAEADPGKACIFTANGVGATEPHWKNAKFAHTSEPDGTESIFSAKQGFRLVFHTTGFNKEATGTIPAGGAYLVAGGPWAVTAP
jgi:hypothetical protein